VEGKNFGYQEFHHTYFFLVFRPGVFCVRLGQACSANSHGKCNRRIGMTSRAESGSLELFKDFRLWRARNVILPSYHGRTKCHIPNAMAGLFRYHNRTLPGLPKPLRGVPSQVSLYNNFLALVSDAYYC